MRDCPKRKAINALTAQHEEQEKADEEARMSSLQLLNAVKAKAEAPKTPTMYVGATVNGKTSRALVDSGATHKWLWRKQRD